MYKVTFIFMIGYAALDLDQKARKNKSPALTYEGFIFGGAQRDRTADLNTARVEWTRTKSLIYNSKCLFQLCTECTFKQPPQSGENLNPN